MHPPHLMQTKERTAPLKSDETPALIRRPRRLQIS